MHASQQTFIERENEESTRVSEQNVSEKPKVSIFRRILLDRRTRIFTLFIIFVLVVPILVFYFVIDQRNYGTPDNSYTCSVEPSYMVSCGSVNTSVEECKNIQCCYDFSREVCYHSLPSRYGYNKSDNEDFFPSLSQTPFGTQTISKIRLSIIEVNSHKVQIIVHTPNHVYENKPITDKQYEIRLQNKTLGIEVFRKGTKELLLTTMRGPLIASDGYWEWNFQLTDKLLFGLGEIKLEENQTITKVIYKNRDDHNTLPNFMGYLEGSFHGVAVEHDGPLEVIVLPSKVIVLRSLAEDKIILNLCVGPTPKDVVKQMRLYESTLPPPYWALGAHICRDGKTTIDSAIKEYKKFIESETTIQYSSDCIHEHLYMMLSEVNEEHQLKTLIQDLQEKSHFLMSVPPQILQKNSRLYEKAAKLNVLYKDKQGKILNGSYFKEEVSYPDFTHDSINSWIEELRNALPVSRLDGFVLKDNWPEEDDYVFSDDERKFPYVTEILNSSLSKTIPWNATSDANPTVLHIFKHNKYGSHQINAFNSLKASYLMTSSFTYGMQEAAVVQNVNISWTNLKKALTTTLYHSMFGNSLISFPVCGSTSYFNVTHEELCMRWYLLAVTLPIFRVSSEKPRRDPSNFNYGFFRDAAYSAIRKRYMLLPYYYSLLSKGELLTRPMFYDFHMDNKTFDVDEQYMLGNALLVAQPLLPSTSNLRVYLPPDIETWYEFWNGTKYTETGWINLFVVNTDWVMFFAEGNIIPLRNYTDSQIGVSSQDDTFSIAVALKCNSTKCHSEGSLDLLESSLTFSADGDGLTIAGITDVRNDLGCNLPNSVWPHAIGNITIYGLEDKAVNAEFDSVNLCKVESNETYIKYFPKQKSINTITI